MQAKTAQNLGFKQIISDAYSDGTGKYVGPYVWAKYGFDAALSKKIRNDLGLNDPSKTRVSDLIGENLLQEAWKKYVVNHSMDLTSSHYTQVQIRHDRCAFVPETNGKLCE